MVRKPSQRVEAGSTGEIKERKGLWSPEEDERLFNQITGHGVSTWSSVAQLAGLSRSGKSCRLRWMNYLRPDLNKEPISKREEEIIISLQQSLGNRWSMIAARMPGRTDNEIKNYWNSRIRKRLNASAKAGRDEERASAAGGKEELAANNVDTAAALLPVLSRYPLFACQLLEGGCSLSPTTTTQQQNGSADEAISDERPGEDAHGASGHSEMVHDFLAFDELDYSLTVMDAPDVMDAWDKLDYPANSISSLLT